MERYQFPDTSELVVEPEAEEASSSEPASPFLPEFDDPEAGTEAEAGVEAGAEAVPEAGAEEAEPAEGGFDVTIDEQLEEEVSEPEPEGKDGPITFAQIQAQEILADARREADRLLQQAQDDVERILRQAREDADARVEGVFADAREDGYQDGYAAGMAQAAEESKRLREEQAQRQEEEVHRFMEQAGVALDRQMDQSVDDLRDLALAVAEKVVCVSLKSSADVVSRMIQTAIDKRKKKEWVHIYISECDAKRLTQIPASLTEALSALSNRVRIIPMSDDESGTCIIEMPDEIVDASTSTQLNNLRTILMDTANSASGINLFH